MGEFWMTNLVTLTNHADGESQVFRMTRPIRVEGYCIPEGTAVFFRRDFDGQIDRLYASEGGRVFPDPSDAFDNLDEVNDFAARSGLEPWPEWTEEIYRRIQEELDR